MILDTNSNEEIISTFLFHSAGLAGNRFAERLAEDLQLTIVSAKYNKSDRIVSDIQCRAAGETFYIRYNTGANIVLYL